MKAFAAHFPYLEIEELISYFAVFDGYTPLMHLRDYETLLENIEMQILHRYDELKANFIYVDDQELQKDIEKLLYRIAIGNRKIYSIYKDDIPQFHGSSLYQTLFSKGIITKELSREKPLRTHPSQPIKKAYRKYQIEDKIHFVKGFDRFWFTFIAPHKREIETKTYADVMQRIESELDKFISLTFESLCNALIRQVFAEEEIVESGSYWDKDIELDVLARTKSGTTIAGEAKWKNQKISKNILNKLQKKCEYANLSIDIYALFSKNGFSNELIKLQDKNLLLYDLTSFKGLFDAR